MANVQTAHQMVYKPMADCDPAFVLVETSRKHVVPFWIIEHKSTQYNDSIT